MLMTLAIMISSYIARLLGVANRQIPKKDVGYEARQPMIGAPLVIKHIRTHGTTF
jgi:hypothetical protein